MFGSLTRQGDEKMTVRFDDTTIRALRDAHRRKWTAIASLVAIVGACVGIWGYSHYSTAREEKLAQDYLQAETEYRNEIQRQRPATEGAPEPKPSELNHDASTKLFMEFAKKYPDHPQGWVAGLRAATDLMNHKKLAEAKALLEMIVPRTIQDDVIQVRLRRTLAAIYAQEGNFDQAIKELDIAINIPSNDVAAENQLFKAQVLHMAGKNAEAIDLLKKLAAKENASTGPQSQAAKELKDQIAEQAGLWLAYWEQKPATAKE